MDSTPSLSNEIVVRQAQLEDWEGVKGVVRRLHTSRFAAYLSCSEDEARAWLVNSLQYHTQIGLLTSIWNGRHCGLAALMAMDVPQAGILGVGKGPRHAFMHSVYIDPFLQVGEAGDGYVVPSSVGKAMCSAMEQWARERGANYLYGNCRNNMHFDGLLRKYGFAQQHVVIGKELI